MKKIVILHPDLGIGGAERLIVDLAVALKQTGEYAVTMVTAHHDENHCFKETRDGTLDVRCVGDWLPRSVFGYCYALCAYIRMIYAALYVVIFSNLSQDLELIICDQISACIPFMKLFTYAKIMFYCHFPDQLLTDRKTNLKKVYRVPIDWLEEKSTGLADVILVNSKFTGEVFRTTFKSLDKIHPTILYPSVQPTMTISKEEIEKMIKELCNKLRLEYSQDIRIFLSLNRFERKKNVGLAIESLALLKKTISEDTWKNVYLIVAGGYDQRVIENIEHFTELEELAKNLGVSDHVRFLRSCSENEKQSLLHSCCCLLYTPDNEHFGIVPVEAMQIGRPVIAVNSGGPKETVINDKTGYLRPPNKDDFSAALKLILENVEESAAMGLYAKQHVHAHFSFEAFSNELNRIVKSLIDRNEDQSDEQKLKTN
ncbi:Alpha-1,3-mannosyltransferase-like protein [Chamberlinius hualienensis]